MNNCKQMCLCMHNNDNKFFHLNFPILGDALGGFVYILIFCEELIKSNRLSEVFRDGNLSTSVAPDEKTSRGRRRRAATVKRYFSSVEIDIESRDFFLRNIDRIILHLEAF